MITISLSKATFSPIPESDFLIALENQEEQKLYSCPIISQYKKSISLSREDLSNPTPETIENTKFLIWSSRLLITDFIHSDIKHLNYYSPFGNQRSPLGLLIFLATYDGPYREKLSVSSTKSLHPNAILTDDALKMIDTLLKREGRLIEAWMTVPAPTEAKTFLHIKKTKF